MKRTAGEDFAADGKTSRAAAAGNVSRPGDEGLASRADEGLASRADEGLASRADEGLASRADDEGLARPGHSEGLVRKGGRLLGRALALAATWVVGACAAPPAAAPPAELLTLFQLDEALASGQMLGVGVSPLFPAFSPANFIDQPSRTIRIARAFAEGKPAAYMTTDLWLNFPVVWVQPMYLFVTAWDAKAPAQNLLRPGGPTAPPAPALFSVGPESAFYSPFWQVFYVEVPKGTAADRYRSIRQILADNLPIHPGPARLAALKPAGLKASSDPTLLLPQFVDRLAEAKTMGLAPPPPGSPERTGYDDAVEKARAEARDELRKTLAGTVLPGEGWADGDDEKYEVLDFGTDRFEWNDRREVLEQPLFYFFYRAADGHYAPLPNLPRIAGTGPLYAGRPALAPNNKPLYGSLWRLWAARLPPGRAAVFIPDNTADRRMQRATFEQNQATWGITVEPPAGSSLADQPAAAAHTLQVALNPACFHEGTGARFPDDCHFIDSQQALERELPAALEPSQVLVSCPFVMHAGEAVKLP